VIIKFQQAFKFLQLTKTDKLSSFCCPDNYCKAVLVEYTVTSLDLWEPSHRDGNSTLLIT